MILKRIIKRIWHLLTGKVFGRSEYFHYTVLDSTNDHAKRLINASIVKKSAVLIADVQTNGKTTKHNKVWQSQEGNLYITFIYKIQSHSLKNMTVLSSVVSAAILKTIYYFAVSQDIKLTNAYIKWPNDVFINHKKVSGVLIETEEFNNNNYVIIGSGINILLTPILNDGKFATSLFDEGIIVSPEKFAKVYIRYLKELLELSLNDKYEYVRDYVVKHSYKINEYITIKTKDNTRISGKFVHIDKKGAMILETKEGELKRIVSGRLE